MTPRILAIATAGVAALTLAACNRPAEEPTTPMSEEAVDAASTAAPTTGSAPATSGSTTSAAGESSGSMSSGDTMSGSASASGGSAMSSAPAVNSDIPADAPSRNTRETAGAAGSPNPGQPAPYAYSPTNPAVQAKK